MAKPTVNQLVNNNQGMILITALWIIVLIGLLAMATLILTTNEYHITANSLASKQAHYLAEGGIEEAIHRLKVNPGSKVDFVSHSEHGQVTVKQSGSLPQIITLEAEGSNKGSRKTLLAQIEVVLFASGPPQLVEIGKLILVATDSNNEFMGNIYCGQDLELSDFKIIGDVCVRGDTRLENGSFIQGDLYLGGQLILGEGSLIEGKVFTINGEIIQAENTSITGGVETWDGLARVNIHNWRQK